MKDLWKTFKELWAITRLRSSIILCLWLIFIGFIVIGLRNSKTDIDKSNSLEYKNYDNYEVVYKIGDIEISGTTYNNESYLYINDELSYNGEVISQTFNNINLSLLQPKNLNNLLNQAVYDSKTTYTDSIKYNYVVSSEIYNDYMGANLTSSNVIISIIKENDLVTEIEFANVSIIYTHINEVTSFNK